MRLGKRTKERIMMNIFRALLIIVVAVYMLPFFWMISTSLKPDRDLFLMPPKWFPIPPEWSNYKQAIEYFPFLRYFINSVIITAGSVLGTLLVSPLVAYGFSKIYWPGRDVFFYIMLSTMM
ncbi:MAG TPA: carbohydrate ABC transporter permease, partial [Thermotogales bacterium]|nr:carbohydrate ABC transporter permease [Thermotogales bacterium]